MSDNKFGRILGGDSQELEKAYEEYSKLPLDQDCMSEDPAPVHRNLRTISKPVTISGPGTFMGKETRTLHLEPTDREGWWFDRSDHAGSLPVKVSIRNVWTTGQIVSNIVLRSGPPHNYIRLVEHIIALRSGLDIDNLMIRLDSGDPPLFNKGSLDLVEALEDAGRHEYEHPVTYLSVKEKVTFGMPGNKFLTIEPVDENRLALDIDCAVNFKTAIRTQRISFPVNYDLTKMASVARTNTSFAKMLFCATFGKFFADIRNLGYNMKNVLVAGKFKYVNEPRLDHEGKALEAVWHRAVLDLLAAVALIDEGRLLGKITSYKAGHSMDVEMIRLLYKHDLLKEVKLDGKSDSQGGQTENKDKIEFS